MKVEERKRKRPKIKTPTDQNAERLKYRIQNAETKMAKVQNAEKSKYRMSEIPKIKKCQIRRMKNEINKIIFLMGTSVKV